jgi:hypothetical protein
MTLIKLESDETSGNQTSTSDELRNRKSSFFSSSEPSGVFNPFGDVNIRGYPPATYPLYENAKFNNPARVG